MAEFIKQHIIKIILTIFIGILGKGYARLKKEIDEQKDLKIVMLAILHDKLYQESKKILKDGAVSVQELENLEHLYKAYSKLGGNGTCKTLYEKVHKLEIKHDNI